MSLDKLLHKVKHIYLTGNLSEQVLAAQVLSRFQDTKHLIIERLGSQNPDLVLTSLECLALDNEAPIEPILNCYQYWDDSEIKLASLMAIEHNQHSLLAVPVLLEAVCDENDYWDGGWNDGDDISLIAARILDNHKHRLDHEQSLRLLHRLQNDPEPDLKGKLIALLSRHSPTLLNGNNVLKSTADTRMLLRSTQDKVVLYKATQHPDISCQKVAFQALSKMDCREYLQVFLSGLSHSEPSIRKVSVHQLAKWNYLVDIKHLNFELLSSGIPPHTLTGLLSNEDKLDAIARLQNQPNAVHSTATIILLISQLDTQHKQQQLDHFIPIFYQVFSRLDESEQLDSLITLLTETCEQLSVAFIRQQLQQEACSNSIKRLLIEHLSKNPKASHQSYLKEITLGASDTIVTDSSAKSRATSTSRTNDMISKEGIDANDQPALITSTLDALKQPHSPAISTANSSSTLVNKRSKRLAKIEELENQAIALEFCSNKTWLYYLCSEDKIGHLTKAAFHALILALYRHNINFSDVQSSRFNALALELVLGEECESIDCILDWLGDNWINQNRLLLMSSPNLSLKIGLIKYINDEQSLLKLIKHSYIGIQIAALNQLALHCHSSHKKLISLILEEPLLHSQLAKFDEHAVFEKLENEFDRSSSTTLQATLTYLETKSTENSNLIAKSSSSI